MHFLNIYRDLEPPQREALAPDTAYGRALGYALAPPYRSRYQQIPVTTLRKHFFSERIIKL